MVGAMRRNISFEYKGFTVTLDHAERWSCPKVTQRTDRDVVTILNSIDRALKPPKKDRIKRLDAFYLDTSWGHRKFIPVTITSIAEKHRESDALEVWVVFAEGDRKKVNADGIVLASNLNAIEAVTTGIADLARIAKQTRQITEAIKEAVGVTADELRAASDKSDAADGADEGDDE